MNTLHAQILWQVMDQLHDANQLEEALSRCLDLFCRGTGSTKGSIWMLDEQSGRTIATNVYGTYDATGESAGPDEGLAGRVVASGVTEIHKASEVQNMKLAGVDSPALSGKNMICVPVKTPRHTVGCLLLTGKETEYTEEERTVLEQCCSILALDIEDKGFTFRPFEDRDPLVQVRGIVKEFMSGEEIRQILKGVDLDVYPGELVVVLGESGCGKSTLLNIIGGMDTMTKGQVLVEGKDLSNPTESELTEYRREYVGFIFQAYNLMPNLSAFENIEFIAEISDNPMDSLEALKLVGLEAKANSMPTALSGGQMQRISIARALVKNPKIILADEPTAALDYDTSIKVLSVIEKISKENNTTILMVTHNPEIAKMANRVVRLRDGKISSIRVNLKPLKATDLVW
ncbi:MAG: ATP-binding cassette domain-containing protein [Mogibacterium sp.]|nr:ATP-binding cassette domain-containing protein [Mogibacterium sp.]